MAKAKVGAAGIEYIQGALKRPKKQDGHNHGNYLVATHRVAPTTSSECQRLYSFDSDRYKRNTPLTEDELAARARFRAVSRAIAARKADLSKLTADQAAFKAQKDQPGGAQTMLKWYWLVEGEAYDESQD